jgi:pimeloyl-ACP methyl ester carboxylesterase
MIETSIVNLPHGIDLSVRSCGKRGSPVLMFLHGFPEAAFVWDEYLEHFTAQGYRAVAPNLRGFERSSSPAETSAYRAKHLVQDIAALIELEVGKGESLACLVAHDWGGAIAWNLANQLPHLQKKLIIINSPHPGTFLRELQNSPAQQAASQYMNFLARPDAPALLAEDNFRRLWEFFTNMGAGKDGYGWLTDEVRAKYQAMWSMGLNGGCSYYATSPVKPDPIALEAKQDKASTSASPTLSTLVLPRDMLTISIPTQIVWGMGDIALRPELLDGLGDYIADLRIHKIENATHWITHEQPTLVKQLIEDFLPD